MYPYMDMASREFMRAMEQLRRRDRELRNVLAGILHGKDRAQIAAQMGITKSSLNEFVRQGAPQERRPRLPALLIEPLTEATGSDALARLVVGKRLAALMELGLKLAEMSKLESSVQRLRRRLQRNGRRCGKKRGRK